MENIYESVKHKSSPSWKLLGSQGATAKGRSETGLEITYPFT